MVTCPKCKAENRPEAAFCSRCGMILFSQPVPSKSDDQLVEAKSTSATAQTQSSGVPGAMEDTIEPTSEVMESTPVVQPGFLSRPEGTVFGERFRYDSLLSRDDHEIRYTVAEIPQPDVACVRMCSNPECQTIHCPVASEAENFCTQCGHPLEDRRLLFVLQEADADQFSTIKQVLDLNLVHPNIHPPVAAFQEEVSSEVRYYLATPYSEDLPSQTEIQYVLEWGSQLAMALDYLQSKGVALGEEVNLSGIGLVNQKVVWRNFNNVRVLPLLTDREKINNLRWLGLVLYSLMTGKME